MSSSSASLRLMVFPLESEILIVKPNSIVTDGKPSATDICYLVTEVLPPESYCYLVCSQVLSYFWVISVKPQEPGIHRACTRTLALSCGVTDRTGRDDD